jgi:fatty acid desaturase
LKGYEEGHLRHHACTNQKCDPLSDSEKYRVCDVRNPKLWLLFLKDVLGITALSIRFMYDRPSAYFKSRNRIEESELEENSVDESQPSPRKSLPAAIQAAIRKYACIGLVQLLILGSLFSFNLSHYVLLWLVPLVTAHMVLMRIRGIAEHGLGIQLGVKDLEDKTKGWFYTRSFGTPVNRYAFAPWVWLERFLIGSLDVYYHHEHHLYPKIPYYNLSKIHKLIHEKVTESNPNVYVKGYFACLLFNLKKEIRLPA